MAIHKLLTWRGSEGIGASPAPDGVLVDFTILGSGGLRPIDNSTIGLGGGSAFFVSQGTIGVTTELETINDGVDGAFIVVKNQADITIKHGIGNIKLAGGIDFYMEYLPQQSTLTLLFDGANWLEVSRGVDLL
jgi:hypothetical protein